MKKFFVMITLLSIATPISADIINPNLTPEQVKKLQAERQKIYIERQRFSTINRVCGTAKPNMETESCKKKLYEDYLKTIDFLESRYGNEHKNLKNTVNK